jgi:hypothetical protein
MKKTILIILATLLLINQGGAAMHYVYKKYIKAQWEYSNEIKYIRMSNFEKSIKTDKYLFICFKGELDHNVITNEKYLVYQKNNGHIKYTVKDGGAYFSVKLKLYEFWDNLIPYQQKKRTHRLSTIRIPHDSVVEGCDMLNTPSQHKEIPLLGKFNFGNTIDSIIETKQKNDFIVGRGTNEPIIYIALFHDANFKKYSEPYSIYDFEIESIGEDESGSILIGIILMLPALLVDLITLPLQLFFWYVVASSVR